MNANKAEIENEKKKGRVVDRGKTVTIIPAVFGQNDKVIMFPGIFIRDNNLKENKFFSRKKAPP